MTLSSLLSSLLVYGIFWICLPPLPLPPFPFPALGNVFEFPALRDPELAMVGLLPVL